MFSAIRKRVSYANVAMTLALVFAMSSGAYAAGKYLITSTKQISPKVLASLKGKAGPAGKEGPAGRNGANGAQGPVGEKGAGGPQGPAGPEGKQGPEGEPGTPGANGQTGFTETLPTGKTETGTWVLTVPPNNPSFGFPLPRSPISFVIPLETPPVQHFLAAGAPSTTECPGSATEPKAAEGQLCVYAIAASDPPAPINITSYYFGAMLVGGLESEEPGGVADGSWAVTAP